MRRQPRPGDQNRGHPRPSNLFFAGALILATSPVLLGGCAQDRIDSLGEIVTKGAAAGYNVVLVTIDTARQDHFGCYGREAARTPCIDALAADGVRFDDAIASAPLTLPSHATILTGLDPPRHGVHDNGVDRLGPGPTVLAEVLAARGYSTGAFVGAFVLDERYGLARGFTVYDFAVGEDGYRAEMPDFNERSARAVTDAALGWLDERAAAAAPVPFFAWLHYFDPHRPYASPLQELPAFADLPYDAEIAYVDQQLQRLVDWLDAHGQRERTLIVVTADHGESLGEHSEDAHGMFVYDSTLRVPLVISCPSLLRGPYRCDERAVGLVDLRPTIQDLLGIATADTMDGLSLLDEIPADPRLYIETAGPLRMARCAVLHGLRAHDHKYILAPEPEYYDLVADPQETRNLHPQLAATLAPLETALAARLSGGPPAGAPTRQISEEEIRRLGSLGYTVSTAVASVDTLPDPKWLIAQFNAGMQAEQLYAEGSFAGAAKLARAVVRDCGGCLNAVRVLAFSELRLGRPDTAIAVLQAAVADNPDRFLVRSLAQAMVIDAEYAAALEVLDLYAEIAPRDGWVPLLRGDCQAAQHDYEGALENFERARTIDPHRAGRRATERIARTQELIRKHRLGG